MYYVIQHKFFEFSNRSKTLQHIHLFICSQSLAFT